MAEIGIKLSVIDSSVGVSKGRQIISVIIDVNSKTGIPTAYIDVPGWDQKDWSLFLQDGVRHDYYGTIESAVQKGGYYVGSLDFASIIQMYMPSGIPVHRLS